MIVPYRVLCHFSPPAVFRIAGGRNIAQDSRCLMQMWNQNTEKSPGATQDILEIAGGATRHLKNRRGPKKWHKTFHPLLIGGGAKYTFPM